MIFTSEIDLLPGESVGPIPLADAQGNAWDSVSIHAVCTNDDDFDSGVITVRKGNTGNHGDAVGLNATPVTLTAPGMKELLIADYGKAAFLFMAVTTAASSSRRVKLAVSLKRLGFSLT